MAAGKAHIVVPVLVATIAIFGIIILWRTTRPDRPAAEIDVARGAAIYAEACASCHGAELQGQPNWRSRGPDGRFPAPPHDASGHTWHHSDSVLLDIIMRGTAAVVGDDYESDMPGFAETYSEAELRDVLEWIKTRWPERERDYQAQISAGEG